MTEIEIIPTNTCPPDFAELSRRSEVFSTFSRQVHLDIDDAIFAPVLSWPYQNGQWAELEALASGGQTLPFSERMKYEAHLMVEDPLRIGELLARTGCRRVLAHIETFKDAQAVGTAFSMWKAAGATEVGLAVLIDTPLSSLENIISECDAVLLMSIATLGSQGAPFDVRVLARIEELHAQHPDRIIAVDGGVAGSNIADLVRAGARRFGVGSAISKAPDPAAAYNSLLSLANAAL